MFELARRNYIVTGGTQGIGFAVTRAICEYGANVVVLDIQEINVSLQTKSLQLRRIYWFIWFTI
jgi:NAD(P)-dependent dehydrogenase (short-subunit alcohol dehydrogenase family)